jgi:hypothetical protein
MANPDFAFGARLVGHVSGSPHNARITAYVVPASDATALGRGDFVKSTGTGAVNEQGLTLPSVTRAAAGDTLRGFIVDIAPNVSDLSKNYRQASTLQTVYVCDDPDAIFEIQSNGTGAITDFGANANIVVGTLNTTYGFSGTELDESSVATTNTLQLRILGMVQRADNEIGANVKYLCKMNLSELASTTGV